MTVFGSRDICSICCRGVVCVEVDDLLWVCEPCAAAIEEEFKKSNSAEDSSPDAEAPVSAVPPVGAGAFSSPAWGVTAFDPGPPGFDLPSMSFFPADRKNADTLRATACSLIQASSASDISNPKSVTE